ncbi:MAG: hypothetical protein R3B90_19090 [Planctomycetaceae bacterium]
MRGTHCRLPRPVATVLLGTLVGCCLLPGLSSIGRASDAVNDKLVRTAENISRLLKGQGQHRIKLPALKGPDTLRAAVGAGMVQRLHAEFARHGIEVSNDAAISLVARYELVDKPVFDSAAGRELSRLAVRIDGQLVDASGAVLTDFNTEGILKGEFEETVVDEEAVLEAAGISVALSPSATDAERDATIRDHLVRPAVELMASGTRLRASADSPYELEILVNGQPQPIRLDQGQPFVDIARGETYAVRVYNHSESEAGVKLLIDGLNVFTFSEVRIPDGLRRGEPKYANYIVGPGRSPSIRGWHKTNERVASFQVARYAESAAAKLGHQQDLGTITVHFSAAWPIDGVPPPDEIIPKGASGNATAEGPPLEERVQEARRNVGRIRASLTVRYSR